MSASITRGSASGATSAKPPDDTLTLIVGGQSLTGWQSVRVTRSLDRMPSDFDIQLTEKYPGQAAQVIVNPGQSCVVRIGQDTVLTGYIDRVSPSFGPRNHEVRIMGRSKCEDICDCSITPNTLTGMTMTTASLLDLATTLAKPYGITVTSLTGNNVPVSAPNVPAVPLTFQAILTETPWDIIERIARYVGVICYDGADGNLIIANVGASTMASGFQQGVNVEAAAVSYSMDQRYSNYLPTLMGSNMFGNQGVGGISYPEAFDKGVPRFRELIIVSEQFGYSIGLGERRAQWEAARRAGRAQAVRLTCDSWRDQAGTLWAPNAYAQIYLPALKATPSAPWVIGDVTFRRGLDGTHADLVLMPAAAFQPQPETIGQFPYAADTPAPGGGAAAATPPPSQTGPGGLQGHA
jgi:prophage tail gpP-like protein